MRRQAIECRFGILLINFFFFFLQMSAWASSKFVPGQFTGSTGANVLTAKELSSGFQAWAKRVSLSESKTTLLLIYQLQQRQTMNI